MVLVAVSLVMLTLMTVIGHLRNNPYSLSVPFAVGAIGCGGLFHALTRGTGGLYWYALATVVVLAPLVPRLFAGDATRNEPEEINRSVGSGQ